MSFRAWISTLRRRLTRSHVEPSNVTELRDALSRAVASGDRETAKQLTAKVVSIYGGVRRH